MICWLWFVDSTPIQLHYYYFTVSTTAAYIYQTTLFLKMGENLKISLMTFNMGNAAMNNITLFDIPDADIFVFGLQESTFNVSKNFLEDEGGNDSVRKPGNESARKPGGVHKLGSRMYTSNFSGANHSTRSLVDESSTTGTSHSKTSSNRLESSLEVEEKISQALGSEYYLVYQYIDIVNLYPYLIFHILRLLFVRSFRSSGHRCKYSCLHGKLCSPPSATSSAVRRTQGSHMCSPIR